MYRYTIPGHEHAGIVVDPGRRSDLKVGDRITSLPIFSACKKCTACLEEKYSQCQNRSFPPGNYPQSPGTYAEYFLAEPEHVRKIPDTMSDEEASMVEPAATPYAALKDMGINTGTGYLFQAAVL
jgi:threonine dehydrogenase-like Zn-dependent dehydrogenase